MSLTVEFRIARTDLLIQENPVCRVVLKNTGNQAISVLHPMRNPSSPILRVIDAGSGTEQMCQEPPWPGGENHQPLPPGEQFEHEFVLLSKTGPLNPGEYEISAICPWARGERTTESGVVRIRVWACTPQRLSLAYATGGWSGFQYGVSVNVADETPKLVRHTYQTMPGDGVVDALQGPEISLRAEPVLSAPRNQATCHTHWVAWLQEGEFCTTYLDARAPALPIKKLSIGGLDAEIVAPLHFEAAPPGAERQGAAALMILGSPAGGPSKFQVFYVAPDGTPRLGEQLPIKGARPMWAKTHERSDGSRVISYGAQDPQKGACVYVTRWPGKGGGGGAEVPPLATWEGEFIGGGTAMTLEDTLVGATVVLHDPDEKPQYRMHRWTLNKMGQFEQQESLDLPLDPLAVITRTIIRVSPAGIAPALFQNDEGVWMVFDGLEDVEPAPANLAETKFPLRLALFGQDTPILISGVPTAGYELLQLSGDPIPKESGAGVGGGVCGGCGMQPR